MPKSDFSKVSQIVVVHTTESVCIDYSEIMKVSKCHKFSLNKLN